MSKADTEYRVIPPGSCSWCGHKPHDRACRSKIRTREAESEPCRCPRRHAPTT